MQGLAVLATPGDTFGLEICVFWVNMPRSGTSSPREGSEVVPGQQAAAPDSGQVAKLGFTRKPM